MKHPLVIVMHVNGSVIDIQRCETRSQAEGIRAEIKAAQLPEIASVSVVGPR